jgi:NAD(P)-dependent dehydrogenase (short-subunit alcohol dehydrogenase family)
MSVGGSIHGFQEFLCRALAGVSHSRIEVHLGRLHDLQGLIHIPAPQEPFEPFERSRHGIAQLVRLLPITAGLRETLGGLLPAHAFGAVPFAVWKRKIAVELTGSFFLFKAVLPRMMAQQWGRIINFTGLAALQGTDALAGSTELGMVGMTRGMAREYGQHNITANCIGAGGIESEEAEGGLSFPPGPRDPLNRWGTPEEMAFLAVSLASEEAGYVTAQCVLANGGKYFL